MTTTKVKKWNPVLYCFFFLEGDGKIKPVCRETVGPIRRSRSRTCTSFSPPRSSGGSRLPVARQQARRRYSADAGDVAATTTTTRRGTCDTHTDTWVHQLTSGEQVFDGVDCGGRGGLRSSQGPVGHQGLEHAHLLQGLMGNEGEERERGRLEAKNESEVRSFTPKEESDVSTRWVPEGFGNAMKTQLKKKKKFYCFFF